MQYQSIRPLRRTASAIAVLAAVTAGAAACGSNNSDSSGGNGKLPSVITVTSIEDLTGAVGPVGVSTQDGMNLAVKQIASSHMLGSTKIQITYKDTQTTQSEAVSEASSAADTNVDAIFGPVLSTEAVAVAPIVESAKIPTIFTQAGGPGVVTPGGYVFRVTSPQSDYQPKMVDYLHAHGVKTVTMLYDATVPTTAGLAQQTLPPLFKKAGITLKGSYGWQEGTSDFSSYATKVMAQDPDAVGVEGITTEPSPVIIALRNAGYKGLIFGGDSFQAFTLKAAGQQAKGVVWATDFDQNSTFPQTVAFVKAYVAAYHAEPLDYAAEGYDAVYLLAYGLKDITGAFSRDALKAGLQKAASAGFDGALGKLDFVNQDLVQTGYLQTYNGSAVESVPSP
jgi:branched-chain amino acid transport system substrate-binding protein